MKDTGQILERIIQLGIILLLAVVMYFVFAPSEAGKWSGKFKQAYDQATQKKPL